MEPSFGVMFGEQGGHAFRNERRSPNRCSLAISICRSRGNQVKSRPLSKTYRCLPPSMILLSRRVLEFGSEERCSVHSVSSYWHTVGSVAARSQPLGHIFGGLFKTRGLVPILITDHNTVLQALGK